jgi:hypothetical protein
MLRFGIKAWGRGEKKSNIESKVVEERESKVV